MPQVARLFRAAAEAETVHAHNHLRALNAIRSTMDNLQAAISGETHEFKKIYLELIEAAKAEGQKVADKNLRIANSVERVHAQLFQDLLDNLENMKGRYSYYVCPLCGFTSEKEAPGTCPVCGMKGSTFKKVD